MVNQLIARGSVVLPQDFHPFNAWSPTYGFDQLRHITLADQVDSNLGPLPGIPVQLVDGQHPGLESHAGSQQQ